MTLPDDLRDELERVEDRFGVGEGEVAVVHEDPVTGEWHDGDGNPVDVENADPLVVIQSRLVMPREQAEREDRDILGPAEDAPEGRDLVQVDPDSGDPDPDGGTVP